MWTIANWLWCFSLQCCCLLCCLQNNADNIWKFSPAKGHTAHVAHSNSLTNLLRHPKCAVLWIGWSVLSVHWGISQLLLPAVPPPIPLLAIYFHPCLGLALLISRPVCGPSLCSVSASTWLREKSEKCQSCQKAEGETWVVRREARGVRRQEGNGLSESVSVTSPLWQWEQAMLLS